MATAFAQDQQHLVGAGHIVSVHMQLPGYIRAAVSRENAGTKVEWAHDSAWRFMATISLP